MVGSGLEAIYAYDRHKPDVVVMDYLMDGLNGITACRTILAKDPNARVVIVSGALQPNDMNAFCAGAYAVLRKPVALEQLQYVFNTISPSVCVEVVEEPTDDKVVGPSEFF